MRIKLLFKDKYDAFKRGPMDASEMVEHYIDSRPDYHDGALEEMQRKMAGVEKVLGFLAQKLTDADQMELAALLGYEVVRPSAPDAITSDGKAVEFKTSSVQRGRQVHNMQFKMYKDLGLEPMPGSEEDPK